MGAQYASNNGQLGFILSYSLANFTGYAFTDFLLDQVSRQAADRSQIPGRRRSSSTASASMPPMTTRQATTLTLNLGLRWAYTSPLVEKDDRQANTMASEPQRS